MAELELIAADAAADDRSLVALERLAAINHASGMEPAAAQARRRLYVRLPAGPRRDVVVTTLMSGLDSAGALEEADALRRHVACPSRFAYAPGADGAPSRVDPLAQDHDLPYWNQWEAAHPMPIDLAPRSKTKAEGDTDTRYVSLYGLCPDDALDPEAAEARVLAWVAVARAHRARDGRGGPFVVPRAIEAYQHALRVGASVPRGPAMRHARLELGAALHAHERYHAAAEELSRAMILCEETMACAPVERAEALMLFVDALSHVDYEGPQADAPVIARPDVIDTESRPDVAEAKLRIALERALEPSLVPKERAFAPDVLAALAHLYVELNQFENAQLTFGELRRRFPNHRETPRVLQAIARVNGTAARNMRVATAVPRWVRAVAAWDDLVAFVAPASPWQSANANDADALAAAALIANDARRELAQALSSLAVSLDAAARAKSPLPVDDAAALGYFKRAVEVWTARATPGTDAPHARVQLAVIRMAELSWLTRSGATVDEARWTDARNAGLLARDAADAGPQRPLAARTLVDLAELKLHYEEARFASSHGKLGLGPRDRTLRSPVRVRPEEELPAAVADAVSALDGMVAASPEAVWLTVDERRSAAGLLLAYGHTAEAEKHLAAALASVCRTPGGMELFVLASEVARAAKDAAELRRLAALNAEPTTTCAKSPQELAKGRALTRP